MDAVCRAYLDTERVFNAGISNYIGHDESVSWNEHFRLARNQFRKRGVGRAVILITTRCAPGREAKDVEGVTVPADECEFQMMRITLNCDRHHRNQRLRGLK
jgi:hypothetical protein